MNYTENLHVQDFCAPDVPPEINQEDVTQLIIEEQEAGPSDLASMPTSVQVNIILNKFQ